MLITAGVMLMIFVLFSFLNSSVGNAGGMKDISFSTSTPETPLIGDGWWSSMPTPIHVAPDPQRNPKGP
jgi:hypothetical protein